MGLKIEIDDLAYQDVFNRLLADEAALAVTGGVCCMCGCTYMNPCIGTYGLACAWYEPDLCTACVGRGHPVRGRAGLFRKD